MERTGPARANTCNKESVSILISIIVLSPGVNLKQCNPVLIIYIVLKLCRTRVRHHCSPGRTSAWGRLKCTLNFFFFFRGSKVHYAISVAFALFECLTPTCSLDHSLQNVFHLSNYLPTYLSIDIIYRTGSPCRYTDAGRHCSSSGCRSCGPRTCSPSFACVAFM